MGRWKSSPRTERGLAPAAGTGASRLRMLPMGWEVPRWVFSEHVPPPRKQCERLWVLPVLSSTLLLPKSPPELRCASPQSPTPAPSPHGCSACHGSPRALPPQGAPGGVARRWGHAGLSPCVCVSHSPFSGLVALSSPPSRGGSLPKPRALELIGCSTGSMSPSQSGQGAGVLLPVSRGSVWAWAALSQSPGCGVGAPWRGATAGLQSLGLVAVLPTSLVMSLSLTIIAGLVLLLRCYSRKSSWRGISGCPPAFITCSSCCPLTRLHCSSQLSMSVLCCHVFCSLLEREPYLQLRSGPGQPRAPCPSAQQSWGTRTSPWRASSALCPGGGFFPQNQCFTLSPKQEDLYF